jgi:hypothetical protein
MTAPFPHDALEGLIAADALHGLDRADRESLAQEMAKHGPDCVECRRLLSEYAETAAWLAFALERQELPSGAEARLLQRARQQRLRLRPVSEREREPRPAPPSWVRPRLPRAPGGRIGGLRRWVATAAAAAVLAVAGGLVGYSVAPRGEALGPRFIAFIARPGIQVATFPAKAPQSLAVVFRPGEREAWVVGTNMPRPQGDRVYELWFRTSAAAPLQPAGVFVPADGTVLAAVTVGDSLSFLAVSVEPPGGSRRPTSSPILATPL